MHTLQQLEPLEAERDEVEDEMYACARDRDRYRELAARRDAILRKIAALGSDEGVTVEEVRVVMRRHLRSAPERVEAPERRRLHAGRRGPRDRPRGPPDGEPEPGEHDPADLDDDGAPARRYGVDPSTISVIVAGKSRAAEKSVILAGNPTRKKAA